MWPITLLLGWTRGVGQGAVLHLCSLGTSGLPKEHPHTFPLSLPGSDYPGDASVFASLQPLFKA